MKTKKILAIFSAAMLACCALGGTAFAEEAEPVDYSQYQLGDITMDGKVDAEDAQLALNCNVRALAELPQLIPYEQQLLACFKGYVVIQHREYMNTDKTVDMTTVLGIEDAQPILQYYVQSLAEKTDLTCAEWIQSNENLQEVYAEMYNRYRHEPSEQLSPYYHKYTPEYSYYYCTYAVKVRD
ncbi:MAG: hypothetical protein IJ060_03160 [Oscillospiraceae bacterium]|nr:hypothetical protein [Oscillospiraceae bacterium]